MCETPFCCIFSQLRRKVVPLLPTFPLKACFPPKGCEHFSWIRVKVALFQANNRTLCKGVNGLLRCRTNLLKKNRADTNSVWGGCLVPQGIPTSVYQNKLAYIHRLLRSYSLKYEQAEHDISTVRNVAIVKWIPTYTTILLPSECYRDKDISKAQSYLT